MKQVGQHASVVQNINLYSSLSVHTCSTHILYYKVIVLVIVCNTYYKVIVLVIVCNIVSKVCMYTLVLPRGKVHCLTIVTVHINTPAHCPYALW